MKILPAGKSKSLETESKATLAGFKDEMEDFKSFSDEFSSIVQLWRAILEIVVGGLVLFIGIRTR